MATETITLSAHAVERFRERVRPALTIEAAEEELAHLVLAGEIVTRAPRWHADRAAQEAPRYLLIADVILPLQPARDERHHVATTCLVKGSPSDSSRARRNRRRVRRSSGRAFPAIAHGVRGARRQGMQQERQTTVDRRDP